MMGTSENLMWKLLEDLNQKKGVTEIVVNHEDRVFVEINGKFIQLNYQLTTNDIYEFIEEVAEYNQKIFNRDHPLFNGTLPDGSRINAVCEPYASEGPVVTIRKYLLRSYTLDQNPGIFGLTEKWGPFIKAMIKGHFNIIVAGATGCGKTTLLNLLLQLIPPNERLILIEDTEEINIKHPNSVKLLTQMNNTNGQSSTGAKELIRHSLRMRPDRIIVGEVRGAELYDLFQVMMTGHEGSMTTIHANNAREVLFRMESLFMMGSEHEIPVPVIRRYLTSAVHFIIYLNRDKEGNRFIEEIIELGGMEDGNYLTQSLAKGDAQGLKTTGNVSQYMDRLSKAGGLPRNYFLED